MTRRWKPPGAGWIRTADEWTALASTRPCNCPCNPPRREHRQ